MSSNNNIAEQTCLRADKIIADCNETINECKYKYDEGNNKVTFQFNLKLQELQFFNHELNKTRNILEEGICELSPFQLTINQAKNSIIYPKEIVLKCIQIRRDIKTDDVTMELKKEVTMMNDVNDSLQNIHEDVKEQLRKYRSLDYAMARHLNRNENSFKIEQENKSLNPTDLNLSIDSNFKSVLPNSQVTKSDWIHECERMMSKVKNELKYGRELKKRAENYLKQYPEQLSIQHNKCNEAFQFLIDKNKKIKDKLEHERCLLREVEDRVKKTKEDVKTTLVNQVPLIAMTQIRLDNRSRREGTECCRDSLEDALIGELSSFDQLSEKLTSKISLAQSSLNAINQDEDRLIKEINILSDKIKADEVDCMTIRSTIHYHKYLF